MSWTCTIKFYNSTKKTSITSHVVFSHLIDFLLQSEQIFQSAVEGISIVLSLYCSVQKYKEQWERSTYLQQRSNAKENIVGAILCKQHHGVHACSQEDAYHVSINGSILSIQYFLDFLFLHFLKFLKPGFLTLANYYIFNLQQKTVSQRDLRSWNITIVLNSFNTTNDARKHCFRELESYQ
jgi:hypothetical protein